MRTTADIVAELRATEEIHPAWTGSRLSALSQSGPTVIYKAPSKLAREAADRLAELDAEVVKLRDEVGNVMRREKRMRESFATWTHRLTRRIQKLKANIADEESYIETLKGKLAELSSRGAS